MGRRLVVAVALIVVGGAGCGSDSTTSTSPSPRVTGAGGTTEVTQSPSDTDLIERKLTDEQHKRFPNLAVGHATCPDGAPAGDVGASVVCTVDLEGVAVPFSVTLLGAAAETAGGAESYEFRLAKPMVDVTELVASITSQASTQLKVAPERITVDCGPAKVQVLDVGGRIPCTVKDGQTTRHLAAVVSDENGSTTINEV